MSKSIKILRRTIAALISAAIAIGAGGTIENTGFPIVSNAAATITDNGTCGENVTWTLNSEGTLTISGEGEMSNLWNSPWKDKNVVNVIIENGVTSIGDSAFKGCSGFTIITIPDSVTHIGDWAFRSCGSLTSIVIPNGVTSIGDSAFEGCSSLTSITIPDGVTSIGDWTFSSCTGLTSIMLPAGVTSIGDSAFYGCNSLTGITIPDGVTSIGNWAFYYCTVLTSITLPDSVTSIGIYAFDFVANVEYSGSADGSPWGARTINGYIKDGIVYKNADKKEVTACSTSKTGKVTIPDSVTSIGDSAFFDCSNLTSIAIPDSVTSIGDNAFNKCSKLKTVNIPDGIQKIAAGVFSDCVSLESIHLPNSVKLVETCAFSGCESLSSINIPNGVTDLGWMNTFYGCKNLKNITIPEGVKGIGSGTFYGCGNINIVIKNKDCILVSSGKLDSIGSGATVYSHIGGKVQQYANKNKITFVSICEWDAGKVTKPAAVGVKGVKTFTCTVCKATLTEDIPALTHAEPKAVEVKTTEKAKTLSSGFVGATHSVKISELLASSNASYVVDKDGKKLTDTSKPLATGMKLVLESNGKKVEKVIAVLGDIDGNGEMAVTDARLALRAAVGLDELKGAYLDAAKVGGKEKVEVSDARLILRAAVQLETGKDWLGKVK